MLHAVFASIVIVRIGRIKRAGGRGFSLRSIFRQDGAGHNRIRERCIGGQAEQRPATHIALQRVSAFEDIPAPGAKLSCAQSKLQPLLAFAKLLLTMFALANIGDKRNEIRWTAMSISQQRNVLVHPDKPAAFSDITVRDLAGWYLLRNEAPNLL